VIYVVVAIVGSLFVAYSFSNPTLNLLGLPVPTIIIAYGIYALNFLLTIFLLSLEFKNPQDVAIEIANIDWRMEEVRGIFVLGIIATLLAVRYSSGINANDAVGSIFVLAVNFLTVYWGAYIFLVSIAIPNELLDTRISYWSYVLAKSLFFVGVMTMPIAVLVVFLVNIFRSYLSNPLFPYIMVIVLSPVGLFLGWLFAPHQKNMQQSSNRDRQEGD
jgi:hypothetical protein